MVVPSSVVVPEELELLLELELLDEPELLPELELLLEELLEDRIHLFLFVKVRENWGDDPARYADWNLDYRA